MKKLFSLLAITSLTATFVATCAAIFSVTGIAKLFAGSFISVAVMAASLELGKIVSVSFLYQNWQRIPRLLKTYLCIASVTLMIVTSAGIYGYLSSAYSRVSEAPTRLNAQVQTTRGQISTAELGIKRKTTRLDQVVALKYQQENRLDSLTIRARQGSASVVRGVQASLAQSDKTIAQLQAELASLEKSRDSLSAIAISAETEINTNSDIGTFVYIAKIFNVPLDSVVKWFMFVIVLVFDPLAIALILAVNFLVKHPQGRSDEEISDTPQKDFTEAELNDMLDGTEFELGRTEVVKDDPRRLELPATEDQLNVTEETPYNPDPQYYAKGDFNWEDTKLWKNNPNAVKFYNNLHGIA